MIVLDLLVNPSMKISIVSPKSLTLLHLIESEKWPAFNVFGLQGIGTLNGVKHLQGQWSTCFVLIDSMLYFNTSDFFFQFRF